MRLFVGIELGEEMKTAAAAAADRLRAALKRADLHVEARWVPRENLHVTLWFIGEVDDERAAGIRGALAAPFQVARFALRAAGLGAFPPAGPPRVLWIGIAAGGEPLAALHGELIPRLAPLGFQPEGRPYAAHLTIARVTEVARRASHDIRRVAAATEADAGVTEISAVTLFRSRVSSKGSTYEPLLRIPLA